LVELRAGIQASQSGSVEGAVKNLEGAAHRLRDALSRKLAFLFLGKVHAQRQQEEAARQAYEQVIANPDDEGGYLSQLAFFELGHAAEQRGDLAQARQQYEHAAAREGPLQAEALLAAARVLEAAADRKAAAVYYERFLVQYASAPLAEMVRQKLGK
jgi:tetratricopeptide (TPR) repeat protein